MSEEFEKSLKEFESEHLTNPSGLVRKIGSHFYAVRQPEIDALKAENERLRKDGEQSTAVHKIISDIMHDHTTAMQSAIIEWQHGKGADAALMWIANTLFGPGLLPDENSPYGKEAQAWFDANKSRPFPKCFCGRPSHILWMGRGFCSEEHYEQREEHTGDAATQETK